MGLIGLKELDTGEQQAGGSEPGGDDSPSLGVYRLVELDA